MAHPLVATSAFSRRAKHSRIVGLGVFVVSAGLVSFGPGINGGYFFDDFLYVYLPSAGSWTDFFGRASGTSHAYRPLEAIILSWIQNHFGWSTWPIHALCFSLHSALAMLTYATARILGLTSLQAGIATIFLMVSQSTVSAVLGNDCLSQVLATTFGFASTFLFWRLRTQHPNATPTFATVLLFGIALFGKETAAGFLPVLALVAFGTARDREWVGRVVASCRAILPFLGAFVLYLASRSHAGATGPASAEGIYSLRFGVNILTNSIELVFSAFSPVSSVIVWTAAQSHRYPLLLLIFAVTAGFVAVTAYGIWKSGRMYVCAMLGVLGLASLSPVLILVHVSELYTYTAMPFFAIVVGAGWGTAIENGASAAARRITALLLAIFLLANVVASRSKAELMYDNGRRAAAVLGALVSELPAIPRNGEVLLVNPEDSRKEYSIFLLNAFNVVRYGNFKKIPDLLGRSDVHILIVEAVDVGHSHVENASAVLTFRNGAIYRIEPQPALPVPIAPLPSLEKRSSPVRDSLVSGH